MSTGTPQAAFPVDHLNATLRVRMSTILDFWVYVTVVPCMTTDILILYDTNTPAENPQLEVSSNLQVDLYLSSNSPIILSQDYNSLMIL